MANDTSPDIEIISLRGDHQATAVSGDAARDLSPTPGFLKWVNTRIESLTRLETRGITRVLPEERQLPSHIEDLQVALLWFSANISVNNLAVGLFGPLVFGLGFLDSAMCATFGGLMGSLSTSYMSIWGPRSGNRTMVRQGLHTRKYINPLHPYTSTAPKTPSCPDATV